MPLRLLKIPFAIVTGFLPGNVYLGIPSLSEENTEVQVLCLVKKPANCLHVIKTDVSRQLRH